MSKQLNLFFQRTREAIAHNEFIKISLGSQRHKKADLKNVFVKLVELKDEKRLSFNHRFATRDITKNFDIENGIQQMEQLLKKDFFNADLFTSTQNFHLLIYQDDTAKLVTKPATLSKKTDSHTHNKIKMRIIQSSGNRYLNELGVTTADGLVKKDMQDKYRQINRYVEIIEGIIKDLQLPEPLNVADMGSGKGYLTFALYDYLQQHLNKKIKVTGVELRRELVEKCNDIAGKAGFTHLHFEQGSIEAAHLKAVDMLIALHACDTATDEAIFKGIKAGATVIICAPCCHKQIRKEMAPDNALQSITQHGILLERQAEIVTDAIRSLIMEAFGYKTKVFDFIATEHTPKNVMIVGVKRESDKMNKEKYLEKVQALKAMFNIKQHYLEKLMHL